MTSAWYFVTAWNNMSLICPLTHDVSEWESESISASWWLTFWIHDLIILSTSCMVNKQFCTFELNNFVLKVYTWAVKVHKVVWQQIWSEVNATVNCIYHKSYHKNCLCFYDSQRTSCLAISSLHCNKYIYREVSPYVLRYRNCNDWHKHYTNTVKSFKLYHATYERIELWYILYLDL